MIETIEHWLKVAWLIFLFVPLFFAILITLIAGVGAIYAIFCNWLIPVTTGCAAHIKGYKETAGRLECERKRLYDVANALSKAQDDLKVVLADIRLTYNKYEADLQDRDGDRTKLNEIEHLLAIIDFPRYP